MNKKRMYGRRWLVGACCMAGTLCQFGGCDITEITTTVTVDGRQLLAGAIRSAVLAPLDAAITQAINEIFDVGQ